MSNKFKKVLIVGYIINVVTFTRSVMRLLSNPSNLNIVATVLLGIGLMGFLLLGIVCYRDKKKINDKKNKAGQNCEE